MRLVLAHSLSVVLCLCVCTCVCKMSEYTCVYVHVLMGNVGAHLKI